ncbi:hypothetical protein R3P38DRAFT_2786508 [Favolaschia claudopus]|uniref:Protein kinase domain-containing protein n=1 Tax=Favolaschia claudopus TaxID=2862362 RepID=A0AAW0ASZ9_9AGAR
MTSWRLMLTYEPTQAAQDTRSCIFGDEPHPGEQRDVLLLFLAAALRAAADKGLDWARTSFTRLCSVEFTLPPPYAPSNSDSNDGMGPVFDASGRKMHEREDWGEKDADNDEKAGDTSSDSSYIASGSSSSSSGRQTVVLSGHHKFTGKWHGLLRHHNGTTIVILEQLATGLQDTVYAAELCQSDRTKLPVVVKIYNDSTALQCEYKAYLSLAEPMLGSIPKCYGLCIGPSFMCLVTAWIPAQIPFARLTLPQKGAIYALVLKLHEAGWSHNDLAGHRDLRNILWNSDTRPVLIDFETARRHKCLGPGKCGELVRARELLHLSHFQVAIYARERVS